MNNIICVRNTHTMYVVDISETIFIYDILHIIKHAHKLSFIIGLDLFDISTREWLFPDSTSGWTRIHDNIIE